MPQYKVFAQSADCTGTDWKQNGIATRNCKETKCWAGCWAILILTKPVWKNKFGKHYRKGTIKPYSALPWSWGKTAFQNHGNVCLRQKCTAHMCKAIQNLLSKRSADGCVNKKLCIHENMFPVHITLQTMKILNHSFLVPWWNYDNWKNLGNVNTAQQSLISADIMISVSFHYLKTVKLTREVHWEWKWNLSSATFLWNNFPRDKQCTR